MPDYRTERTEILAWIQAMLAVTAPAPTDPRLQRLVRETQWRIGDALNDRALELPAVPEQK